MATDSISLTAAHPEHRRFLELKMRVAALSLEVLTDDSEPGNGGPMNRLLAAADRALLASGLTIRDVAENLRVHENVIVDLCLCEVTETTRYEHPQCPRHVLDVRRRLSGALIAS